MTGTTPPLVLNQAGQPMTFHRVFTYCDAADIAAGRQYAFQFMTMSGRENSGITSPDQVIDIPLRPIGGEAISHYGCIREAWSDEVEEQARFHREVTSDLPSLRMICVFSLEDALDELSLEVAV